MDVDFANLLIMALCLLGPAAIILIVFMILQKRRGKFHRQRITKGQKKRSES
jgi:hypothetical protein